jgi:hypothetical protein
MSARVGALLPGVNGRNGAAAARDTGVIPAVSVAIPRPARTEVEPFLDMEVETMSVHVTTVPVFVAASVLALAPLAHAQASDRTPGPVLRGEMTVGQYVNRLDFDPSFAAARADAGGATTAQLLNRCDFGTCPSVVPDRDRS